MRSRITQRGFTLIELLVVISIMSVLASIVLVATNSVRMQARDVQRIENIAMIQTALELYYDSNGSYPPTEYNIEDDGNPSNPANNPAYYVTNFQSEGNVNTPGTVDYNIFNNWNWLMYDLNQGNYLTRATNIVNENEYAEMPIWDKALTWLMPKTASAAGDVYVQDPLYPAATYGYMPAGGTPADQDYRLRVHLEDTNNGVLEGALVGKFLDTCDSDDPTDSSTCPTAPYIGQKVYRPFEPWLECAPQPPSASDLLNIQGYTGSDNINAFYSQYSLSASSYGYYCVGAKRDDTFTAFLPGKPVIYLYPATTTEVSVKISPKSIDVSVPSYDNGWDVIARPDGEITDQMDETTYPYLYWEGSSDKPVVDETKGFVVATKDIKSFLVDALAKQGLNENEADEFIEYWEPRMTTSEPYVYVYFMPQADYDRLVPMTITPKPNTIIRVYMLFKPLNTSISVEPETLSAPSRAGFTVIEWGGDRSPLK